MGFWSRLLHLGAPRVEEVPLPARAYDAAQRTRLNADWNDSRADADREIHWALSVVRSACREAERNNGLFDAMLEMHVDNIVGRGYQLQALPRWPDGRIDQPASGIIEQRWRKWASRPVTLDGQQNLRELCKLAVRSWVRDGEFVLRPIVRDGELRLQGLEGDYIPEALDFAQGGARLAGVARTVNGISVNADGRPLFYHLALEHPGASGYGRVSPPTEAVPAESVLHLYSHKRAGQLRGMPLGCTSLNDLRMLKGYFKAELAAARMNSARAVSIKKQIDSQGQYTGDGTDANENIVVNGGEAGVTLLPAGYEMDWAPVEHPSGSFDSFVNAATRHMAASWNVSHALLTRNLREVNFSSLRIESVACARYFGARQDELIARVLDPIYQVWLEVELLSGRLAAPSGRFELPYSSIDKYREVRFIPPPFPSYDPEKDLAAEREKVRLGIKSLSAVCLEQTGRELADVVAERKEERELLAEAGLLDVQEQEMPAAAPQLSAVDTERVADLVFAAIRSKGKSAA